MPGWSPLRMRNIGHSDDIQSHLFALHGHLDRNGVTTGVGDDNQHIALFNRRVGQIDMGKAGQTFEICCLCLIDVYHKLSFQDTLCLDETAGTAHHLFGNHVRMSRSKAKQHSTVLNAVCHYASGFQYVVHLRLFNTVDHRSHCLNIRCCCHVIPPESAVVRRLRHEPRQRSCLLVGICDCNRDQSCCKHASVCLAVTHGHHVGTLEPKIIDQPAKCDTLADACVHDVDEVPVSLDHVRPGSQAFHDEVPDSICIPRQAYDRDFPHSICCDLACRWNIAQVTGVPAGPPLVDKTGCARVAEHLRIAPTIQN